MAGWYTTSVAYFDLGVIASALEWGKGVARQHFSVNPVHVPRYWQNQDGDHNITRKVEHQNKLPFVKNKVIVKWLQSDDCVVCPMNRFENHVRATAIKHVQCIKHVFYNFEASSSCMTKFMHHRGTKLGS